MSDKDRRLMWRLGICVFFLLSVIWVIGRWTYIIIKARWWCPVFMTPACVSLLCRRLASAIKRGQSYFHLLQKEEQEEQEGEERQRMRREEQLRTEPRPPSFSSDSDSDSEGWDNNNNSALSPVFLQCLSLVQFISLSPFRLLKAALINIFIFRMCQIA